MIIIIIILPRDALGEHKPGRIKPGRIKRAALPLQNRNYYICCLMRPRLYASELLGAAGPRRRELPAQRPRLPLLVRSVFEVFKSQDFKLSVSNPRNEYVE